MKKLLLTLAAVWIVTLPAWAQNAEISPFVRLQFDDKVCHASQYTGTRPNDEGGKFAACVTALPSGGGTIDGRGLEGGQAWSACPWAGVTKSITVLLGSGTRSAGANCTV